MGGAVSSGENNDELVDNLVKGEYIKCKTVERVFRALDRMFYFLPDQRKNVYDDSPWKHGNLHLSAPCIYAKVMEALKLEPVLSFLNLGSGTGYLNTLVGLVLGPYGTNHGIEQHEDVVDYARQKLQEFIRSHEHFDEFDFCEPKFVHGNCLRLDPGCQLYDRVYCGAACPEEHENYMKNLVKVGGILVMPLNEQLLQIRRTSETEWETKSLLPVTFSGLALPSPLNTELHKTPETAVISLQEVCRVVVRRVLRQYIMAEHPGICEYKRAPVSPKKRRNNASKRRLALNLMPLNMYLSSLSGELDSDSDEYRPSSDRGVPDNDDSSEYDDSTRERAEGEMEEGERDRRSRGGGFIPVIGVRPGNRPTPPRFERAPGDDSEDDEEEDGGAWSLLQLIYQRRLRQNATVRLRHPPPPTTDTREAAELLAETPPGGGGGELVEALMPPTTQTGDYLALPALHVPRPYTAVSSQHLQQERGFEPPQHDEGFAELECGDQVWKQACSSEEAGDFPHYRPPPPRCSGARGEEEKMEGQEAGVDLLESYSSVSGRDSTPMSVTPSDVEGSDTGKAQKESQQDAESSFNSDKANQCLPEQSPCKESDLVIHKAEAIPITVTPGDEGRARYTSNTSVSTSFTSGVFTCSSVEDHDVTDFDLSHADLETHVEEPDDSAEAALSGQHAGHSKGESKVKNGQRDVGKAGEEAVCEEVSSKSVCDSINGPCNNNQPSNGQPVTNAQLDPSNDQFPVSNDKFDPDNGQHEPCNDTFNPSNGPPKPSNGSFEPSNVSFEPSNVQMDCDDEEDESFELDSCGEVEKCEVAPSTVIKPLLRDLLVQRVQTLPVPPALQQYLLYYRV